MQIPNADTGASDRWPQRQLLITQRLRTRRAELGLTQKQVVSRLSRCGVHTTNRALSSLEHGAGIDVAKLPELALALDCTVTYLIGLTDDPHSWQPDAVAASPAGDPGRTDLRESLIIGADVPERRFS